MSARTILVDSLVEHTTPILAFEILDDAGAPFQPESLALTWYDPATGAIVNGRDAQPALNQNGVIVIGGAAEWRMVIADTAILDQAHRVETRIALWEWTWDGGARAGKHEIETMIRNLKQVP